MQTSPRVMSAYSLSRPRNDAVTASAGVVPNPREAPSVPNTPKRTLTRRGKAVETPPEPQGQWLLFYCDGFFYVLAETEYRLIERMLNRLVRVSDQRPRRPALSLTNLFGHPCEQPSDDELSWETIAAPAGAYDLPTVATIKYRGSHRDESG